ncbi:hypothetical protein VK70_14345 [Paenibacillus durus ATCC 35681]|uniref:Uncharacterized protein n=1 Tax=Paenibacillus durus ATCC 35681 TaxID=1333534 RepID=A0A0F7FAF1_PAEDU|nr:hypothetical protein VK70_14345 [Paenibacillus durus ATCC 35681]
MSGSAIFYYLKTSHERPKDIFYKKNFFHLKLTEFLLYLLREIGPAGHLVAQQAQTLDLMRKIHARAALET